MPSLRRLIRRPRKSSAGGQETPTANISETLVESAAETSVAALTHDAQTPPLPSGEGVRDEPRTIREELWSRAYGILRAREKDLVVAYESYIVLRSSDHCAAFSSPEAGAELIRKLQQDRDEKQWRVPLGGREHKMRDQVEKLVKLLIFSDAVIKQSVSAQPYAALAWSSVSIFLPVCVQRKCLDSLSPLTMYSCFLVLSPKMKTWSKGLPLSATSSCTGSHSKIPFSTLPRLSRTRICSCTSQKFTLRY